MDIRITKAPEGGTVRAIGSKSMAQRLMIAWALSETECCVSTHSHSDDVEKMLECCRIISAALHEKRSSVGQPLNVGESGANLRFLMPIISALGLEADLIMEGSLPERPVEPLIRQLAEHGVTVSRLSREVYHVEGKAGGGIYELPGDVSSQFISGLLMALPLTDENSAVKVMGVLQSRPYVDMTLDVLKKSGIEIFEDEPGVFYIPGNQEYRLTGEHEAGGDWSSAAMWLSSGACSEEGSSLTVEGISSDSIHGDKVITDILKGMGADILWEGNSVTVKAHRLHSRLIDARDIPDLVPAIAVAACKAEGKTVIMNAERLRLKESDRIRSIADVLKRLGAMVNERPDGLEIFGGYRLKGGTVPSFNDHRIVMMAACLRSQTDGNIIIEDAEAVNKSYPGFFDDYRMLGGKTEEL